jgi:dolichyl-phosphate beta-glucosyltransferase
VATPNITLILPAFNEAATIRNTIGEAIEYFTGRGSRYEIIVAADGDDGTREIVAEMARANVALRVIGDRERLGKGRGVRLAAAMATGDIVGYADADNKVPISEFDKFAPWFSAGADLVIGSRALAKSEILRAQPLYRRIGSYGFAFTMQMITGVRDISDTQCGFKFFRNEVAARIFQHQQIDGYMFDVEILSIASRLGYRIQEVPIRWCDDGDSRLELVRGNLRNMRDLFRIRTSMRAFEPADEPIVAKRAARG